MYYINKSLCKCTHSAERYIKFINSRIELNKARPYNKSMYESHHILPKSMGGTDKKINRVNLTYREHYIAHLMLYMIYRNNKMAYALLRMNNSKKINSHLYEQYRHNFIESISGKNNPMYGKNHTEEAKKKISEQLKGEKNHNYGKKGILNPLYGKKRTDEFINSMLGERNPMYGKNHSLETKHTMSLILSNYIYIIRGKKYNCIFEACNDTNLTKRAINIRCDSTDKKYSNYIKLPNDTTEEIINLYLISTNIDYDTTRIMTDEEKSKISNSNTKYYYLINDIKYNNTKEVAQLLNLSLKQIRYRSESDKYPNFKKIKINN